MSANDCCKLIEGRCRCGVRFPCRYGNCRFRDLFGLVIFWDIIVLYLNLKGLYLTDIILFTVQSISYKAYLYLFIMRWQIIKKYAISNTDGMVKLVFRKELRIYEFRIHDTGFFWSQVLNVVFDTETFGHNLIKYAFYVNK